MDPRNIELSILNNYSSPNIALTEQQKFNWLQLIRTPHVGPITFRDLINTYGGSSQALEALPDLLNRKSSKKRRKIASASDIYRELDRATALNMSLIARGEAHYPKWLGFIDDAPLLIYARGQLDLIYHPIVAIVGSRKASAAGKKITETFASEFGRRNLMVASGLAKGIDTAAHRTALMSGTIAVVAGGLNMPYPEENRDLHGQISKQGVIISESPPDMRPRGVDFPRRNRIISGISQA
ncbi:MAG: DNA-processing protein DprA, partial [Methyloligellaceae bacterium]